MLWMHDYIFTFLRVLSGLCLLLKGNVRAERIIVPKFMDKGTVPWLKLSGIK